MAKSREETLCRMASMIGLANILGHNSANLTVEDLLVFNAAEPSPLNTVTLKIDAGEVAGRLEGAERLFFEIIAERERQDAQWGGAEHDDTHNPADWCRYIWSQNDRAATALQQLPGHNADPAQYRGRLVKIAALAFAAMESFDRANPRPVENPEPQPTVSSYGKEWFLALMDDALPAGAHFRGFSVEYWGDLSDGGAIADASRARDALKEHLGALPKDTVSREVRLDTGDDSITLMVRTP